MIVFKVVDVWRDDRVSPDEYAGRKMRLTFATREVRLLLGSAYPLAPPFRWGNVWVAVHRPWSDDGRPPRSRAMVFRGAAILRSLRVWPEPNPRRLILTSKMHREAGR